MGGGPKVGNLDGWGGDTGGGPKVGNLNGCGGGGGGGGGGRSAQHATVSMTPVAGRWLTRDPAGFVDGMNL
jgi:hypothetical protein